MEKENCTNFPHKSDQCKIDTIWADHELNLARLLGENSSVTTDCKDKITSSTKSCAEQAGIASLYNLDDWNRPYDDQLGSKITCCLMWLEWECLDDYIKVSLQCDILRKLILILFLKTI